ncbi:MAG: hypothetical protein N3A66_07300, partial [Planctomycetota bacterium]|nr:hypothetical protein [Planctomycetota bacterium]
MEPLNANEHEDIIICCVALNQYEPPPRPEPQAVAIGGQPAGDRPGDQYSADPRGQAEALEILLAAGWQDIYQRGNVHYLRRPGKDRGGISATFGHVAPGVLYVFSSSAAPLEPNRAYSPFQILAIYRHGGDFGAATRDICQRFGYEAPRVDMSGLLGAPKVERSGAAAQGERDAATG